MMNRLYLTVVVFFALVCNSYADEAEPKDGVTATEHKVTLNGQTIEYTYQAVTLPIKNEKGEVTARMYRIASAYYEAGHMMYIHKDSRLKLRQDLVKFILESVK